MKLVIIACLAVMIAGQASAQVTTSAQIPPSDKDKREIGVVIEAFRAGIIAKDKAALDKLPVSPGITFVSASDAETITWVRKRRPTAKRLMPQTYPGFVQFITSSKDRLEETFADIAIQSDGTIANVYFTYQFKQNGEVSNSGHENWGLVFTDDGWKISSIIWSENVREPKTP